MGLGFGIWGFGLGVRGLGFGVRGPGFRNRFSGFGFRILGLGLPAVFVEANRVDGKLHSRKDDLRGHVRHVPRLEPLVPATR